MQFIYKNLEVLHGRDKSGIDLDRQLVFFGYMTGPEIAGGLTGIALKDKSRDLGVTQK